MGVTDSFGLVAVGRAMRLTGQQYRQFTEALLEAFTLQRLSEMVRFRLDKNLDAIALGDDQREIVFKLIGAAEAEGWTDQLLLAAREANPGSPALLAERGLDDAPGERPL